MGRCQVKWFKKRKKDTVDRRDVPVSTILRWVMYDVGLDDDIEITKLIGLTPVSAEGNEKELEDSEDRLYSVKELLPFIELMGELSSKLVTAVHARHADEGEEPPTEEELESLQVLNKSMAMISLVSAFSIATHLGLISIEAESLDLEQIGDMYEF